MIISRSELNDSVAYLDCIVRASHCPKISSPSSYLPLTSKDEAPPKELTGRVCPSFFNLNRKFEPAPEEGTLAFALLAAYVQNRICNNCFSALQAYAPRIVLLKLAPLAPLITDLMLVRLQKLLPYVQGIEISNSPLTSRSVSILKQWDLRYLRINCNFNINRRAFLDLAASDHKLHLLELTYCLDVDDDVIRAFLHNHPNLKYLQAVKSQLTAAVIPDIVSHQNLHYIHITGRALPSSIYALFSKKMRESFAKVVA